MALSEKLQRVSVLSVNHSSVQSNIFRSTLKGVFCSNNSLQAAYPLLLKARVLS